MATKCKSCGADIIWAETTNNKRVPLDSKPEKRFIYTSDHEDVYLVDTYQSHFATCPNAAQHRKR